MINLYISGWWLSHPSEKYESQLGWLFPVYGKIQNVPNHQSVICVTTVQDLGNSTNMYLLERYRETGAFLGLPHRHPWANRHWTDLRQVEISYRSVWTAPAWNLLPQSRFVILFEKMSSAVKQWTFEQPQGMKARSSLAHFFSVMPHGPRHRRLSARLYHTQCTDQSRLRHLTCCRLNGRGHSCSVNRAHKYEWWWLLWTNPCKPAVLGDLSIQLSNLI